METTIPYADLKAIIGLLIVSVAGLLALYFWIKNKKREG